MQIGEPLYLEEGEDFEFRIQTSSMPRQVLKCFSSGTAQIHTSSTMCWNNPLAGEQKSVEKRFTAVFLPDDSEEDSLGYVNVKCRLRQRLVCGVVRVPYSISAAASMYNTDDSCRDKQTAFFR